MSKIDKKKLFDDWLSAHTKVSVQLYNKDGKFEKDDALRKIQVFREITENTIYLLVASMQGIDVPIYIGKSKSPFTRWKQHILAFEAGTGSYRTWRSLLLNGHRQFNFDVQLTLIREKDISCPPVLGFPSSVGAVEYQLINLISDVYPETLLNSEGNRR